MRRLSLMAAVIMGLLWAAGSAFSASDSQTLNVNAAVSSWAKLTLGVATINFPDADPDAVTSIPATENAVSVTAKARTGAAQTATLTCLAGGDLTSGSNTIAISNVTWQAGGDFISGTMNKTTPQSAGSWIGPSTHSGTFSYFLANSWSYATGNYSATITYTLTAP